MNYEKKGKEHEGRMPEQKQPMKEGYKKEEGMGKSTKPETFERPGMNKEEGQKPWEGSEKTGKDYKSSNC